MLVLLWLKSEIILDFFVKFLLQVYYVHVMKHLLDNRRRREA